MKDKSFMIELKCLFCGCVFKGDSEKKYVSGDMLECQKCTKLNDYDALIDVIKNKGKALATDYARTEIKKRLKKIFK